LISGLIVCTILPFVKLKLSQSHALQQTVFQFEELLLPEKLKGPEARYVLPEDEWVERANPEAAVSQHTTGVSIGRPVSPVTALTVIYWLGVGIMLLRLGASFISLYCLLGKSRRIEKEGYKLIVSSGNGDAVRNLLFQLKDFLANFWCQAFGDGICNSLYRTVIS
jgi:hypothetical protein